MSLQVHVAPKDSIQANDVLHNYLYINLQSSSPFLLLDERELSPYNYVVKHTHSSVSMVNHDLWTCDISVAQFGPSRQE